MSPTHDPLLMMEGMLQGAIGPELSSLSSHGRAGSCPIESEMQGAMEMEPLHRKTGSLDLNFSIPSPLRQPQLSMAAIRPEPKPLSRERYVSQTQTHTPHLCTVLTAACFSANAIAVDLKHFILGPPCDIMAGTGSAIPVMPEFLLYLLLGSISHCVH